MATTQCGCKPWAASNQCGVSFCKLHTRAPEMLDCLKELEGAIAHWRRWGQADLGRFQAAYDQIRAILNALEG